MGSFRFIALVCAGALIAPAFALRGDRPGPCPAVVLWAWERPVDLRGLPAGAGGAFFPTTSPTAHPPRPSRAPPPPPAAAAAARSLDLPGGGDSRRSAGARAGAARRDRR